MGMGSYTLPRGASRPRPAIERAFFRSPSEHAQVRELTARIELLERMLRAVERIPSLDPAVFRAAITHTRLVCESAGYAIDEIDEPPPDTGAAVERDGRGYTVLRLTPSPFPGDRRRCAVLVPAD